MKENALEFALAELLADEMETVKGFYLVDLKVYSSVAVKENCEVDRKGNKMVAKRAYSSVAMMVCMLAS